MEAKKHEAMSAIATYVEAKVGMHHKAEPNGSRPMNGALHKWLAGVLVCVSKTLTASKPSRLRRRAQTCQQPVDSKWLKRMKAEWNGGVEWSVAE